MGACSESQTRCSCSLRTMWRFPRRSGHGWSRRGSSTSPEPRPGAREGARAPDAGAGRVTFPLMRVGLVGAGNMARALARGWGDPVLCSDGGSGRARALAEELGGEAVSSATLAERADLVVLCHKPAQVGT